MNQSKAEEIVAKLLSNAAGLRFGSVAVCISFYSGQLTQIVYSTTENTKAPITKKDAESEEKQ